MADTYTAGETDNLISNSDIRTEIQRSAWSNAGDNRDGSDRMGAQATAYFIAQLNRQADDSKSTALAIAATQALVQAEASKTREAYVTDRIAQLREELLFSQLRNRRGHDDYDNHGWHGHRGVQVPLALDFDVKCRQPCE